jgi:hypothetical protein
VTATHTFPCGAEPDLFHTDQGAKDVTVQRAKKICHTCPAMFICRERGRQGREYGVWGGESYPERRRHLISAGTVPECGTEPAFQRHLSIDEECDECREAHRERARVYDEARRRRKREEEEAEAANRTHAPVRPECGTPKGYKLHQKRKELSLIAECTCREAYAEARKQERRAAKKEAKAAA